ncbi:MAG: cyclic nucleotide-binding domain-containing protein [Nitrospira sp.]|nr:cyclic nucleotide-binding domain-containing protein [Nitrospira sp.]
MKDGELGRVYGEGEFIFKEGDEGDRMYVIQSGRVRITKKTPSGDITIATLGSGEIFGEMALFDRLPRSATAGALDEARILSIDKKKLFQTIDRDPTLVFKTLESMSRRIRRLDEEFTKLRKSKIDILQIFVNVDETCSFILEEAKNFIKADNGSIMLYSDEEKALLIKAAFGTEWNPKTKLNAGEGIAGDVLKTGRAELINNVSMDPRYKKGSADINSVLCVPIKGRNTHFGVINMSRISENLFTIEDLNLLRFIALYASIAIENAMNFSRLRNVADEVLMHATMLDMLG